jgi:molybdopterin molybdotransferase
MVQLRDDCFNNDGKLLLVNEAIDILVNRVHPIINTEVKELRHSVGRIIAEDIISERNVPPDDNSAVDGFAVYYDDLAQVNDTNLIVGGRATAGHPLSRLQKRGEAIRIFTGAEIPKGVVGSPDTVLMQEDCKTEVINNIENVIIPPGIQRGANTRYRGEDVSEGSKILNVGTQLRPQEVGLAASIGLTSLNVFRKLRVAIISTGDELFEPGTPLTTGGIYDSNRYSLLALISSLGCEVTDLGIVPDSKPSIKETLNSAAMNHDAIISSAGVSVGEEDHLRSVVLELGHLHFWKLAIKPGRPVAFGQIGRTAFIGLPGNPVAMMITFLIIARPALLKLSGASDLLPRLYKVQSGFDYRKKLYRREYVRVNLTIDNTGDLVAHKFPRDGAGILSSLVGSEGIIELSEETTQLKKGEMVEFLPFTGVS